MIRRAVLALVLAVSLLPAAPAPVRAEDGLIPVPSAALTAAVKELRAAYGIPGIQAAVIYADGRAWSANGGFADLRARVRPVRSTPFAVGSVTKTFVAALVLQLVAEGRLTLDDAAAPWVPELAIPGGVTIRHLLSHTSGLHDYFSNSAIDRALRGAKRTAWTPERALSYARSPYFLPGNGWAYSNTNYLVLGLVAERSTGLPLATLLRDRFLEPLRLSSVVLQGAESPRLPVAHAYTFSSTLRSAPAVDQVDGSGIVPFTSVTTAAWAAGAMAASAWDLARWSRALFGGEVLPTELVAAMQDASSATGGVTSVYGLGVRRDRLGGYAAVGHSGRLVGTWASMRYFPELGVSIAVTTNQWRWSPDRIVGKLVGIAASAAVPPPSPLGRPGP